MREAAVSAGALIGLLAFAGVYQHQQRSIRARRQAIVTEHGEVVDLEELNDGFAAQELAAGFSQDVGNITEDGWYQMQAGLGISDQEMLPFEMDDEEVTEKQAAGRRRKKKTDIRRFKLKDVPKLHNKMKETYEFRQNQLLKNFVEDSNLAIADRTPPALLSEEEATANHVVNGAYPDYTGNDRTHPSVEKFLDEFGYQEDGKNLFREGQTQVWFLVPAAVPLFSETPGGHLIDYPNYWTFISKWAKALDASRGRGGNTVRISIGLYHKGAVYSPRGTTYRAGRFPWKRVKNYYMRPRTTTSMPYVIPTAESLLAWIPRFGAASASAGQDCFTVWFHQDFSADANQLLLPEQFAKVDQLYQVCTVMHVFVGVPAYDPNTLAFASALVPGLQGRVAKDPEYSGVFWAPTLADVGKDELLHSIYKYMTVIKARAGCRMTEQGYIAPPSMGSPTEMGTAGAGFQGTTDGTQVPTATVGGAEDLLDLTAGTFEGTEAATVRGFVEQEATEAPKIPEIDSCCGHDIFSGIPYDSELRTCCEDGQPQSFTDDGSDPCMALDLGFEFK